MADIYPDLFKTILVPKTKELVATPYRFEGNKEAARQFFEDGLRQTFHRMRRMACPDYPVTVFYAFKQTETEEPTMRVIANKVTSLLHQQGGKPCLKA